ncbi:MAG: CysB family HTH-type transcriptional regulator [Methylophilaceae bacterium]|nr:CysB family HTH-type transcriptional regulator [Methylophilaceae bacterium]
MKLHQLRYIREVARQNLNVSLAAEVLHTSQPGVSKQIQLLEQELGLQIFHRSGKRLTSITEPGRVILAMAERMLREVENIKRVGEDYTRENEGTLTIATTHTQARYRLPPAVKAFIERYPNVRLSIHQGSPTHVADLVETGEADVGIATESIAERETLAALPCYTWNRCVVTPLDHPLLRDVPLTLEKIARYPIVTYDLGFTGSTSVKRMFESHGLRPNIVLTAIDSDVIKTYVELGLGIGLLANMAFNAERDINLARLDASHLFPDSTTYVAVRRDAYLRSYVYEFIRLIAPHLDRQSIDAAL